MENMVSIICMTYNHEPYIADAIEGFLMQKTSFNFEILIGEDHSSDRTLALVESYQEKYPDKIKVITSNENVGAEANALRVFSHVTGKYIALCEGDDYWTDPFKLQKQVDYMENHPECTLCFHNADVVNVDKTSLGKHHVPWTRENEAYYYGENHSYNVGELALLDFIPTASLLIRTSSIRSLPDFYFGAIAGDLVIRLAVTSKGYAYFIDEVMSAYRTNVPQSASAKEGSIRETKEGRIDCYKKYIYLINQINEYSNYEYKEDLEKAKTIYWEGPLLVEEGRLKELKSDKYLPYYNSLNSISKIKFHFRYCAPAVYQMLKAVNESVNKYVRKNK